MRKQGSFLVTVSEAAENSSYPGDSVAVMVKHMTLGAANSKLNLAILHAHDRGRYNAAYGHALPTTNIAALADDGFVFRDAHCAAPTCSPIRAAMLNGWTAHEVGMLGLAHRGWYLDNNDLHLAADQAFSVNLTEMRKRLDA